jgi:hypothetical protein
MATNSKTKGNDYEQQTNDLYHCRGRRCEEWYASRRRLGDEAFRKELRHKFFPSAQAA